MKCSLAIDNGRTREFIRKREYPDKSKCYECGVSHSVFYSNSSDFCLQESGHLSYVCPKNSLGNRIPPVKKRKKIKKNKNDDS